MDAAVEPKVQKRRTFRIRNFLSTLGPGLITGASDDDPSGIGTYSQAGAQLGFGVGWTMLLSYPLMAAIQEISGRIGRVTGHGIAGNVCRNFGAVYVWSLVGLLFVANTINIAADLGAMADALKLLIGGPGIAYVVLFGTVSVLAQIFFDYARYVSVLKWLTLSLFAYVIALAVVKVPWGEALKGILIPRVSWDAAFLTTLVAILGTTISPYLFVWQWRRANRPQRLGRDPEWPRGQAPLTTQPLRLHQPRCRPPCQPLPLGHPHRHDLDRPSCHCRTNYRNYWRRC